MSNYKILVVDDESRIRRLIRDYLVMEGFDYCEAENGEQALQAFYNDKDISLIILDVMMPELDGFETLREIRLKSSVPVIMLTAKTLENDELFGFESGADEYIAKPFSPKVLVARIKALLKRSYGEEDTDGIYTAGPIRINEPAHIAYVGDTEMVLSAKEFELLVFFIKNQNVLLTRETILGQVWEYDYFGDERTIDTHVKKLRSKLGEAGDCIKTIWGKGYKFEVKDANTSAQS